MLPLLVTLLFLLGEGAAQNDFSEPIKCYTCTGTADNSSCADPINVDHKGIVQKECDRGICLKWTKYKGGVLQMIRTCSSDLDFHLTMIDGVCRTERNGNGWLCMCGKHLCNAAPPGHTRRAPGQHAVRLFGGTLISFLILAWSRRT